MTARQTLEAWMVGLLGQPEDKVKELLDRYAHELAQLQRSYIPDDAPGWVKILPDLIDPRES